MNPISIIGAGIGGLTLGNILRQHNLDFTVYESAPEIKPVGSGIMMAINAMQIFDKLGLKEKIEKAGNKIHGISITDEKLKLISQTHVSELEKKYSSCNVAIHRAELQKILAENLRFKNIKLNHSLKTIQKDDNYLLQFENGHQTESKIVFGADGIHSRIRNQIFRTGTLRSTHQMCWRGLVDFNLPEKFYHEAIEAWGKGKRFGFVKMTDNKLYWYAVINKGKYNPNSSLSGNFHGFHPLINEIIESTSEENIILNDLLDLSPIPKWHTQNLCLIGDAAHATTPNLGQGACQAIEDAYIIGKLLEQTNNFNSIFENFQKIRRKKVDHVVSTSWKLGKFFQWEKATYLRNALMRSVPERITRKMVERVIQLEM